MKFLFQSAVFIILLPGFIYGETWDFAFAVPYIHGSMKQHTPISVEMGVTSVKGYGFSWEHYFSSFAADELRESSEHKTETISASPKKYWDYTYTSRLSLNSNAFHFYYRFEQYVHRWDLGLMLSASNYSASYRKEIKKCTDYSWGAYCVDLYSNSEIDEQTEYSINYRGPFLQYSNTLRGYDRRDAYYGIRIFTLSRDVIDAGQIEMEQASDAVLDTRGESYRQFILDNNPKTTFGFHLSFGWRL